MPASRSSSVTRVRDMPPAEFEALKNSPEAMLRRGGRQLQTASNQIVRLSEPERKYLTWLVAERARRAS
jgi:hypothetical protein